MAAPMPAPHEIVLTHKLSSENVHSACKLKVKKSAKMKETEKWARKQQNTTHEQEEQEQQEEAIKLGVASELLHSSSPLPEHLPRPRISIQPGPSLKANPQHELTVISDHATINDWQSDATATTHLQQQQQFSPMPDVQFIGQTPTSLHFQPNMLVGTVIGPIHTDNVSTDPAHHHINHPSPTGNPHQQVALAPVPLRPRHMISDPLVRARITLQEALATTPQARSNPNSPANSPLVHHQQHPANQPQHATEDIHPCDDDDDDDGEDEQEDDEDSGLSPIKEDRTAEMAAEHSWRIRHIHNITPSNSHSLKIHRFHTSSSSSSSSPSKKGPDCNNSSLSHHHRHHHHHHHHPDQHTQTSDHSLISLAEEQPTQNNQLTQDQGSEERHADTSEVLPACSQSINDEHHSIHTISVASSDDIVLPNSHPPQTSSSKVKEGGGPTTISSSSTPHHHAQPSTKQLTASPEQQQQQQQHRGSPDKCAGNPEKHSDSPEQHTGSPEQHLGSPHEKLSPRSVRTTSAFAKSNPPLSLPASARRPLPVDLLNRLEMEEWRNQTGIDDRHSLSLRPAHLPLASGSFPIDSAPDIDRAGLVGVGGEERRGIKDRWGNAWGLESHVLSPLSEHTEQSLTTVGSLLSLSTRKSNHSLRSLDSTSNSLAQRLEQADTSSARLIKLGSSFVPSHIIRTGPTSNSSSGHHHQMARSISGPINRIDSPTKLSPFNKSEFHPKDLPHVLLEEKMKRKEERRLKREKREKRRAEEIKSSESLAQKQERRRQEKKRKEEFLQRKHQILLRLQEDVENPQLVRDLGILYLTSNVGIAGLKLAIRHLETSLQMNDSDPLAWSSLGKAWSQLHGIPEAELAKLPDARETDKAQQAHNATIGLRKAIINSRTHSDALKYKVEWARYLETLGRWRDSLGVISEVIKNEGKMEPKCWATLGFIGLRIVFGWAPLDNLETDDLEQGFLGEPDNKRGKQPVENKATTPSTQAESLSDPDRVKLLSQVHHAFERAVTLIDQQVQSASPQNSAGSKGKLPAAMGAGLLDDIGRWETYRKHYQFQLAKVEAIQKEMPSHPQSPAPPRHNEQAVSPPVNNSSDDQNQSVVPVKNNGSPDDGGDDSELITEEIRECQSASAHSSPAPSCVPVCQDPEPTNYVGVGSSDASGHPSRSRRPSAGQDRPRGDGDGVAASPPRSQTNRSREITGADYLDMATPSSQVGPPKPFRAEEDYEMAEPTSDARREWLRGPQPAAPDSRPLSNPFPCSGSSDGPEFVVQYDDLDTTNDYSDSRNSDPFRPSSSLGHHLIRASQFPRPLSSGSHDPRLDPAHAEPPHLSPADPPPPPPDRHSMLDGDPRREEDQGLGPATANTQHDPSGCSDHQYPHASSMAPVEGHSGPDGMQGEHSHSGRRSTSPSHPHSKGHDSSSNNSPADASVAVGATAGSGGAHAESSCEEPATSARMDRRPSGTSSHYSLHHHHPRMRTCSAGHSPAPGKHDSIDLGQILVESQAKSFDKDKVLAFLEIDSDYHAQVLRLRKQLLQVEEEREKKRKEMFSLLGLRLDYAGRVLGDDAQESPAQRGRDGDEEEQDVHGSRPGAEAEMVVERGPDGRRRSDTGAFASGGAGGGGSGSGSGRPTWLTSPAAAPHHHGHGHRGPSRSLLHSPPSARRARNVSLDPHDLLRRTTPRPGSSAASTAVAPGLSSPGCLPRSAASPAPPASLAAANRDSGGDHGNADIALQGIAAILKLASSSAAAAAAAAASAGAGAHLTSSAAAMDPDLSHTS